MPVWALLLAAAAAVAYVVWIYLRDARTTPLAARLAMIGLRLAAVFLLLLLLTGLTVSVERTGLPLIVVMLDHSASMGLEDRYEPQSPEAAAAEALLSSRQSSPPTRLSLAKSLLTRGDARFLTRLLGNHKLRVYRFAETAIPVGQREYLQPEEIDELARLIESIEADGTQTRHGPSVGKVLDDLRGAPPTAIVLLSDGITSTTESDRLSAAAESLVDRLVPLYAVGIGSQEPARDLQLYDLLVDEVAFVDDPIIFSAKLKSYGFDQQEVAVTLRDGASTRVLAIQTVQIASTGEPVKIELAYTPPVEGEFDYTLSVATQEKETNTDNNSETRHISVRREKIRVLLADLQPRYEFRYLKHLLEREKTVQVHTVLQDADIEYSAEDETVLDHFPVKRDELFDYDVVIFGDVNPDYLSSTVFENLNLFVRDKGAGIIFIAGPRHNPLDYRGTPLEVMLPVELDSARLPAEASLVETFRPELTLEGIKGSNIFRFAQSEQESLEIWSSLPGLYWLLEAPRLRPGAVVFAEHPLRKGDDRKLPVVVMQQFGAGKTLFHATDELWRWRFRMGDLYYGRYWVHAIRYLSRSKLLGKERTVELTADRMVYQRGETAQLRARFLDERLAPVDGDGVTVAVEHRSGTQQRLTLWRLPEAPTVFEGELNGLQEGSYHAWVVAPAFRGAPPSTDFRVEVPQSELEMRSLDEAELIQTAKATRGRYYSLGRVETLPDDIPAGQPVPLKTQDPIPLWNRWELLLLFALLLSSEWLLRKRYRLI